MWTKLKEYFITSMCLIIAPYIDVCRFGAPRGEKRLKTREEKPLH
jgi:hypothetical protein